MKKINLFLIKRERKIYFISLFLAFFLIFLYIFQVYLSVSEVYSIDNSKKELDKILAENTELEQKYYLLREKMNNEIDVKLVKIDKVIYISSEEVKVVYND